MYDTENKGDDNGDEEGEVIESMKEEDVECMVCRFEAIRGAAGDIGPGEPSITCNRHTGAAELGISCDRDGMLVCGRCRVMEAYWSVIRCPDRGCWGRIGNVEGSARLSTDRRRIVKYTRREYVFDVFWFEETWCIRC